MNDPMGRIAVGIATVLVLAQIAILVACPGGREERRERPLAACRAAAGDARANLSWLPVGHPKRERALLLLSRDVAWAPVCATSAARGARLRDQITAVLGNPDVPDVLPLARTLVATLEEP